MSSGVEDVSVLGKRERDDEQNGIVQIDGPAPTLKTNEDDSDDDVGPMPMPASAQKKKRRGIHAQNLLV